MTKANERAARAVSDVAANPAEHGRPPLTRLETSKLAVSIRALLHDPDAALSTSARHRWEGALAACEAVLGLPPSLVIDDPDRFLL